MLLQLKGEEDDAASDDSESTDAAAHREAKEKAENEPVTFKSETCLLLFPTVMMC